MKMARTIVVKDNALINASYNLELIEQRLILLAIIEARATGKGITPNDTLTIAASSYMNNFKTNRNAAYKALKEACDNLFERQFSYVETNAKGNKEIVRSRWVSEIRYIDNEANVKLVFSPTVAPLIMLLEKQFTSYELEQVSTLNSKYAVRLYEIVIAWRSTSKTPMISVDELRDRLGVQSDEYLVIADFKRWVLDKSLKQVNEKTDILISYEQHKSGRNIVGFTFSITHKLQQKAEIRQSESKDENLSNLFEGLTDLECSTIQTRIDEHIFRLESKGEIISGFHRENIVKKAVLERWGIDTLEQQQKVQKNISDKLEIEKTWQDIPNGTKFRHIENDSVWVKEPGGIRDDDNRVLPDSQISAVFKSLERIE